MEQIVKEDPATKNYTTIVNAQAAIVNVDVKKDTMKAMERMRQKMSDIPNVTIAVSPSKAGGRSVSKDYSFQVEGDNAEESIELPMRLWQI